jgi:tripartite ATP-independent transporter DctP family solute receptor
MIGKALLLGAVLVLPASVMQPPLALAAGTTTVKIGYILAPDSQLGAGAQVFADEVAKRTDGRYKVEQYPNAALGGEVEMMKGVQLGTVDIAFVTGAPVPNFVPEAGILNIPFLFRDAEHAHAVLDGPIGQELLKKFAAKDLIALAWGENGMRHLTNSKHPIASPEDLKNLKLRVPQSETMLAGFKALGADVSPLAFPELYGALQTGRFDGQENPIATILASKFYQVQKYLTLSGHVYDPAVFLVSKDLYEDMSESDRAAFIEAAKLGGEASRKFAAKAEADGIAFLEKQGVTVTRTIDHAKFAAAMASATPSFAQKYGAAAIERIRDYKVAAQ